MASSIVAAAPPPPPSSWVEASPVGGLTAGAHHQHRSDPTTLPPTTQLVAHFSPDFVVQNHPQPTIYDDGSGGGAQLGGRNGKGNLYRLLYVTYCQRRDCRSQSVTSVYVFTP